MKTKQLNLLWILLAAVSLVSCSTESPSVSSNTSSPSATSTVPFPASTPIPTTVSSLPSTTSTAPLSSSSATPEMKLPTGRALFIRATDGNYTLEIKSYVPGLNVDYHEYFTENAAYFDLGANNSFGYINDDHGYFEFRRQDNVFKPGYVINPKESDYRKDIVDLSDLEIDCVPTDTFRGKDHVYEVTNISSLNNLALMSHLLTEEELPLYQPTACSMTVTSQNSFVMNLTFASQGEILGKIEYNFTDIKSTTIPDAEDYYKAKTGPKKMEKDLVRIQELFSLDNYMSLVSVDDSSSNYYTDTFTSNCMFRDFPDSMVQDETNTYEDNGMITIRNKQSVADGIYGFTMDRKTNQLVLGDKINGSENYSSMYDIIGTPGFLKDTQVLQELSMGYQETNSDYVTDNSSVITLSGYYTNYYTQREYNFYVLGIGVRLYDASEDKDARVDLNTYIQYNGSYYYMTRTFTGFGEQSLPFIDTYLNSLS